MTRMRSVSVCVAGAVIAGTLGADPTRDLGPQDFGENERALYALDHFRCGEY